MKRISDKQFTYLLHNRLYWSNAYQSLTLSARNLMWCFVAELKFTGSRKKKNFSYTNNGEISFSEKEFKANGLGASGTYLNARNLLIEVGFIQVTYRGGKARGDMNKYKLLWIDGVKHDEMRWRLYPNENWKHEIPKIKDYIVGRDTRFKKKNTLNVDGLFGTNLPNELDTIESRPPKRKGSK